MKKNLLIKSGISLLILAASGTGFVSAAVQDEGGMYSDLHVLQQSQQGAPTAVRGAEGPIRSVDVQQRANDIYESLWKYQRAQQFNMPSSERGAQGRAASEADMTTARNQQEWHRIVGPFYGSD